MPDNTGPYVSLAQLLVTFAQAGLGKLEKVMLSSRTVTSAPAGTVAVAATALAPIAAADWIVQGDTAQQVQSVAGNVATLADVTNIANGEARLVRADHTQTELEGFRAEAMAFIDRHTRQWFNARSVTIKVVGNNSPLFQLSVPIVSITEILLNGDSQPLDPSTYLAPASRVLPDDRRNPRILLVRGNVDIYALEPRIWQKDRESTVTGVFGFLEPDGSTPLMIQRATLKLAAMRALSSPGAAAATSAGSGGKVVKREKTDRHEVEYFNPADTAKGSNLSAGTGLSGDDEVDDTIAAYRSPIILGGSIIDVIPREGPEVTTW